MSKLLGLGKCLIATGILFGAATATEAINNNEIHAAELSKSFTVTKAYSSTSYPGYIAYSKQEKTCCGTILWSGHLKAVSVSSGGGQYFVVYKGTVPGRYI